MPGLALALGLALAVAPAPRDTVPADTVATIQTVTGVEAAPEAMAALLAWDRTVPRRFCLAAWHVAAHTFGIDTLTAATPGQAPCNGAPVFVQIPGEVACGIMAQAVLGDERPLFFLAQYAPQSFRFCFRVRPARGSET